MESERIVTLPKSDGYFAEIVRMVDRYGAAVVALDNHVRYLVTELGGEEGTTYATEEEVMTASRKLMERNQAIYQELAK